MSLLLLLPLFPLVLLPEVAEEAGSAPVAQGVPEVMLVVENMVERREEPPRAVADVDAATPVPPSPPEPAMTAATVSLLTAPVMPEVGRRTSSSGSSVRAVS